MKRFLRIAVLRGGKVVDERYVPEKGQVTVGSSAKNTFALIGSDLPKEHVLFHFQKNHPLLHVVDGMGGDVALDGKSKASLESLKGKGHREGGVTVLEIPDAAKGWVSFGDATFFFQVTAKPPPPPKRDLPKEARTGFLSGLEVMFVGIMCAVLAVEGVAILAIHQRPDIDADAPVSAEDLDRFAEIIMPEQPKEQPKEEEKPKEDEDAKRKAEEAKKKAEEEAKKKAEEEANKPPEDAAAAAKREAARKEKMRDAVSKKGLLNVIGTSGGSGALANVFASSSGFGADVESALAGAGGVALAGTESGTGRKEGSAAGTTDIGGLDSAVGSSSGKVDLVAKKRVEPQIKFAAEDMETEGSSVDKESISKAIRQRIKSVQTCYEKELKRNPSLKGKIAVRFVITTTGRVSEATIDSNTMGDDAVAQCLINTIKRWTFNVKPEEDSPVVFPFVFQPGS